MSKFDRVLSGDDILTLAERTFSLDVEANHKEIERFAEELERAVLKSLPLQTSSAIRGNSYAGVYIWAGNENIVQHIPKGLAQAAKDPQSMLGALAAECIHELRWFSELQSPEIQALRKDAERYRWLRNGGNDDIGVITGFDCIDVGSTGVIDTYRECLDGEQLDKAIDAAMEKKAW